MEKLPMLKGWKYQVDDVDEELLEAHGSMKIVYEKDVRGYVKFAMLTAQGKGAENTKLTLGTDYWVADTTIKALHDQGLIERAQDYIPYCPVYDTTKDLYTAIMTFLPPAAYKNRIWMTLRNQSDNPIIIGAEIMRIVIDDIEKFKKSYKDLMGAE